MNDNSTPVLSKAEGFILSEAEEPVLGNIEGFILISPEHSRRSATGEPGPKPPRNSHPEHHPWVLFLKTNTTFNLKLIPPDLFQIKAP
jgi:hypothetical protein